MAYRFFKFSGSGFKSMPSQQLLHELHKPIIKKKIKEENYINHLKTLKVLIMMLLQFMIY